MSETISKKRKILVGKSNTNNYEKTIVIYTSLVLAIISVLPLLLNKYIGIEIHLKYVLGFSSFFYLAIFLISRFTSKLFFVKIAITVVSLVFANLLWIFYYNSKGPVLFVFAIYFSLMIFIWDSKKFFYVFF